MIREGLPPLPHADDAETSTNVPWDTAPILAVSQEHDVDSTKSPYDNLETVPASQSRSPDMRPNISKPKPVTAEEAQQKATVMADYLDRPMPDGPQRADYIAQMTEHLVGMSRTEFEDWKQEHIDPAWH